jgi:tight adherence protein B
MLSLLISLAFLALVFVAVFALVVGGHRFVIRRRLAMQEAARSRLSPTTGGPSQAVLVRAEEPLSSLPMFNRILAGADLTPKLAASLRQAGLAIKPGTFLLVIAVSSGVGALLGSILGPLGMVGGGILGVVLSRGWLHWRQHRQINKFDNQLPGAIDMLVSALKTGYSFHVATNFLGQELSPPLGPEFARIYEEQRLGIDPATALLGMQDRIGSVEIKMFVTALLIQRKTGGNLGEVLTNTADVMRERLTIRGQLETLTAEAKWSGRLLALLPVLVFFGLSWIAPDFMKTLTQTSIGHMMLSFAAAGVVCGYFVMMKIAKVDF